jgi:hypothetical protein
MGPSNAIIDDGTGVELPRLTQDEDLLVEEKKMAKYSKTAEFKRIQNHFQERIEFYQKYLPNGTPVAVASDQDVLTHWRTANILIDEFNQVINMYETARDVVGNINE